MYILKNAYKSIVRTKSRNILIGIIILIIGISSCVGLTINNAASQIVKNQKESAEFLASFSIDREAMRNSIKSGEIKTTSIESISTDKILEYAKSDYVKETKIVSRIGLNGSGIKAISSDDFFTNHAPPEESTNNSSTGNRPIRIQMGKEIGFASKSDFQILGYNLNSAMTEFVSRKL